jgi:hypothetical protein
MKIRIAFLAATLSILALAPTHAAEGSMTVFKNPWCGCCHEWAEAMTAAGYTVQTRDLEDLSQVKADAGVPAAMEGCHTATIEGYFLEGHVPLEAVERLLTERPDITGLAVPGMPAGSLGMGEDPDADYDVYAVSNDADAEPTIFMSVGE